MVKKILKIILIIFLVLLGLLVFFYFFGLYSGKKSAKYEFQSYSSVYSPENVLQTVAGGLNVSTNYDYARDEVKALVVPATSANKERMVVRNGYLSLVVKDVTGVVKKIEEYANQKGGFVVSSNISEADVAPYGEVVVRILAKELVAGMDFAKSLGEVKSERQNGQDVTEQYTDLNAQLKNLKATETQFLSILGRSGSISDILSVQRELSSVRGQIERLEGQIKYLADSVEMSLLTVTLSTDPSQLPVFEQKDTWRPVAVFKDALNQLVNVLRTLVYLVIWLVVFIPVLVVIGLLVWWGIKKYKKMKSGV